MKSASMAFVAAALMMGVSVASIRQDMILVDQASMMQLPLQKDAPFMHGSVANLQSALPEKCATLKWATAADCDMSKKLVDFIMSQKGGVTGNDLDVAKRVASVQMLVYGTPGAVMTAFDTDGSDDLSYAELRPAIEADLGMGLPGDENVAKVVSIVDLNGDNVVTAPEIYQLGRACLVIRQFLRDIDSIAPDVDSGDLLAALDKNVLHLPGVDPVNFKWHTKFQDLSNNYTAECLTVTWATDADCRKGKAILDVLVALPFYEGVDTMVMAQVLTQLEPLLHVPDQYVFGMLDPDDNGEFLQAEFWAAEAAPLSAAIGNQGVGTLWFLLDDDASGNVTRLEAYNYVRGGLVLRHFIPELDKVAPGKLKDGSSTLLDKTALNMANHVLDPPPVPKAKLAPGPKLLCIIAIMLGAVTIQWFCCAAKPKEAIEEDEPAKKEVK